MAECLFEAVERLDPDTDRPDFDCADDDLNEFFHHDSVVAGKELLAVTYIIRHKQTTQILAYFSISNDSIKKKDCARSRWEKIIANFIPRPKRYETLPAVKIGRLATCHEYQSNGVGTDILDFLKNSFTDKNKTGCRFIIVDAYNNDKTIKFYQKNGFDFLLTSSDKDDTRLMFYDLSLFKP